MESNLCTKLVACNMSSWTKEESNICVKKAASPIVTDVECGNMMASDTANANSGMQFHLKDVFQSL
jgi:hypothetical protein